jgi:hypothetical protein
MSVKSTVYLSREQAEYRFMRHILKIYEAAAHANLSEMDDEELADVLEKMNDDSKGGEGFENYLIRLPPTGMGY